MNRIEHTVRATRHPPSAADINKATNAKFDEQIEADLASPATEDGKTALDGRSSHTYIGSDSGYASHASSVSKDQTRSDSIEDEVVRGPWPLQRKRRVIDKPIPQAAMERLANLRILLSKPLKEYIFRPNAQEFTILWKLKYLGVTDSDASLYLIVSCDKHIASKVKEFFAQSHIRQQIGLDFRVYIQPLPPIKLNSFDEIPVYTDDDGTPLQTLCGTPLAIMWNEGIRTATLGGILKIYSIDSPNGDFFGITAGHITTSGLAQVGELDSPQMDTEEEISEIAFEEDFELDIEFDEAEVQEHHISNRALESDEMQRRYIHAIGTLGTNPSAHNDWALIKLNPSRCLPNYLPSSTATSEQIELCGLRRPPLGSEEAAVAICALGRDTRSNGLVHGTISRCESGFMMSSGSQLVEIYDFKPKQSSRLAKGDSGSWVVDEKTGLVYGHVVALDAFGEAVIMPMVSILTEIETRHMVTHACLPLSPDFRESAPEEGVVAANDVRAIPKPRSERPYPKPTPHEHSYSKVVIHENRKSYAHSTTSDSGYGGSSYASSIRTVPLDSTSSDTGFGISSYDISHRSRARSGRVVTVWQINEDEASSSTTHDLHSASDPMSSARATSDPITAPEGASRQAGGAE